MKKEYIFPITEISDVEIMNMICASPPTYGDDDDDDDDIILVPGDTENGNAGTRCRSDYGSNSDFGSLW